MKSAELPKISIKKGREWHIRRGHPWLFSGGISQVPKIIESGKLVSLVDCDGKFVASGYYNAHCDIAVRILSRDASEEIDKNLFARRIADAWQLRRLGLDLDQNNVFRLINAEGDFLPGFIVDYYAGVVVVQCHTAGADFLKAQFLDALSETLNPSCIILRNDSSVRLREGLLREEAVVVRGEVPPELIVKENGHLFKVDLLHGQKTGYFTDQRDKRSVLANYAARLKPGSRLLNCFSYTCSFSVYAACANSELATINVDQSEPALELGKKNFELNNLDSAKHEFIASDVFSFLDKKIATYNKYEFVILDPPAFAKSHKDKAKALKAYGRMTTLGLSVLAPGGILVLCSCSGAVSLDEFIVCIREYAGASGRALQIIETFQHGLDHPINLMAPEGTYLKVLFCRVLD